MIEAMNFMGTMVDLHPADGNLSGTYGLMVHETYAQTRACSYLQNGKNSSYWSIQTACTSIELAKDGG